MVVIIIIIKQYKKIKTWNIQKIQDYAQEDDEKKKKKKIISIKERRLNKNYQQVHKSKIVC